MSILRMATLAVSAVLMMVAFAILAMSGVGDAESETARFCRSRQALERFATLAIGGGPKTLYYFDGGTLYARIDPIVEVVAVASGETVTVVNEGLWEAFYVYCVEKVRAEVAKTVVLRLSAATAAGIGSMVLVVALLILQRRR